MASKTVSRRRADELAAILDSTEIQRLIEDLENTRWTGRPGYPVRALLGVALAKSLYAIPTWSRTVALIHEHEALQRALGAVPSVYAAYRFAGKLRAHRTLLEGCIERVLSRLRAANPGMGENIAIDASDLPAYANGQRFVSKGGRERAPEEYSDPDASWGHRSAVSTRKGGGFYGYRIHAAVCTQTGLPVAWEVRTAKDNEVPVAMPLLDAAIKHGPRAKTVAMDKGYDQAVLYQGCHARGAEAIIPLKKTPYAIPDCKLQTPRDERWRALYKTRGAVEREFGRLKHEWAMLPLRVRGLARVRLHVDLTILAKLASALPARIV
ncbi:MAG: transposase [Aliidongia sp.]